MSLQRDLQRLWSPGDPLRQRMLDDHRRLIAVCLMVIGPLSMAFWCGDWANDPIGAQNNWLPRLGYLMLIPSGWLVLRIRSPRGVGSLLIFISSPPSSWPACACPGRWPTRCSHRPCRMGWRC